MKKIIFALLTLSVWVGSLSAQNITWYNNPDDEIFYISTEQDLMGLAQLVNNAVTDFNGKTIVLSEDITLTANHTPIGNDSKQFKGIFDGNGYSISNLSISSEIYAGLFGYVGTGGQIKNLTVNIVKIVGSSYSGGLTAYYTSTKPIENCGINISDVISSSDYSGGLVGYSGTITIDNSYSTGNVSASAPYSALFSYSYSGGLVGIASGAITINNSYSTGNISASYSDTNTNSSAYSNSGGLLGKGYSTITIYNSYSTGNVSASAFSKSSTSSHPSYSYSGGLVGYGSGTTTIDNSYSTGNLFCSNSTYSSSGGLLGYGNASGTIRNSYTTGSITGSQKGGLVGYGKVNISNSYATGNVSSLGGTGVIKTSYFISETSGTVYFDGTNISGIPLEELKKQATFLNWDFEDIWQIDENLSYPYFIAWKTFSYIDISEIKDQTYAGSPIMPEPKVRLKDSKTLLTKDIDYTISYGENKNVLSGGSVVITGIGAYSTMKSETINFKITPKKISISGATAQNKIYDGTTSAEISSAELIGIIDGNNVEINTAIGTFDSKDIGENKPITAEITLKGEDLTNYKLTEQPTGLTANITARDLVITIEPQIITIAISDDLPNFIEYLTYNDLQGEDTKEVISGTTKINCSYVKGTSPIGTYPITLSGLLQSSNYNISYDNIGLALIVTGDPKSVESLTVSAISDQIYTGEEIKPSVVVKDGETTLIENTHYLLSYSNNIEIGNSAFVTIEGIPSNGYSGLKYVSFNIISNSTVSIIDTKGKREYGIKFTQNPVYDKAEIGIILPDNEKATEAKIVIYDMIGNLVFETTERNETVIWNLTNDIGRTVANGSYLVVVEAKDSKGTSYHYSAKLGVKK